MPNKTSSAARVRTPRQDEGRAPTLPEPWLSMAAKARQILRLTGKSGGPVTDLGKLLGQVTPRTIQRWADGTRTPPLFFKWRAIEFCRTHGITPLPFKLSAKEESEARALASEFPVVKLQRE